MLIWLLLIPISNSIIDLQHSNTTSTNPLFSQLLSLFISKYGQYQILPPSSLPSSLIQFANTTVSKHIPHQDIVINYIEQVEMQLMLGKLYRIKIKCRSQLQDEHLVKTVIYVKADGSYEFITAQIMY